MSYERQHPASWCTWTPLKLSKIPDGGGWRATGRVSESVTRDRSTRVGFDYVHSLVNGHSRLAYSEILTDEKVRPVQAF